MVHNVKVDKLLLYGIRGVAFNWLKDYLNNKQHFVQLNGFNLSFSNMKCVVLQGSILSSLLYLIYINDMCDVSKGLDFIIFANDKKIFFSHKNFNFIKKTLNEELSNVTYWCRANKLSINIIKSNLMVFKPRQKREIFTLKINQCTIDRVQESMF